MSVYVALSLNSLGEATRARCNLPHKNPTTQIVASLRDATRRGIESAPEVDILLRGCARSANPTLRDFVAGVGLPRCCLFEARRSSRSDAIFSRQRARLKWLATLRGNENLPYKLRFTTVSKRHHLGSPTQAQRSVGWVARCSVVVPIVYVPARGCPITHHLGEMGHFHLQRNIVPQSLSRSVPKTPDVHPRT